MLFSLHKSVFAYVINAYSALIMRLSYFNNLLTIRVLIEIIRETEGLVYSELRDTYRMRT